MLTRSVSGFDFVVNATPAGMKGPLENETLFTADGLRGVSLAYDLVTKLTDTPLIREAKLAGIETLGGLEMLIAQGARQFEIWTGREAPTCVVCATAKSSEPMRSVWGSKLRGA